MKRKAFLICPVRGADQNDAMFQVALLEAEGWEVHYPPRDTNQDDPTGLRICQDNLAAIKAADCVFIIWDGKSQGSLFDLGVAFAFGKPVTAISLPDETPHKSFQNMIRAYETLPQTRGPGVSPVNPPSPSHMRQKIY